uniref:Large ribosomal subunit protein bL32c n=1 Tax=Biebersteinia heterostemon TaxID=375289 RepID=A0A8F7CKG9_9ROSI|nr:ribosomal protein L32 [Biebersteinia heterostemon]
MAVPKKRTSRLKKRIRKNVWKKRAYWVGLKAYALGKSILTGNSKTFFVPPKNNKTLEKFQST